MNGPAKNYLTESGGPGGNDEKLERLLYETFLDKDGRQKFAELFKESETLYEIPSPSPELRDYIEDYNRLADIYVMLRIAYGPKTKFLGEIAHKTEVLVRENASAHGIDRMTEAVDFDEEALRALKDGVPAKNAKIINLARVLAQTSREQAKSDPVLFGIGERAEAILEAMTERQVSTVEALDRLKQLMEEKRALDEERKRKGFDPHTFAIYWILRSAEVEEPESLATEICSAFSRFPNYESNTDEMRQLKAEIYKILLPVVGGKRMIPLAEKILLRRRR